MVLDIFISIFTEVIKETIMEFVVVPIKRLISYPFTYKSNVEKLRHEAEELKNRTDKLQQAVEEATRKGKEIYESVNTLAKQVHRKAIEENLFDVVAMVAVNQTPKLQKRIQSEIADILGLKFDVGEIPGRANRLYERLKKEKKVSSSVGCSPISASLALGGLFSSVNFVPLHRFEELPLVVSGRSPISIAAAVIYIITQLSNEKKPSLKVVWDKWNLDWSTPEYVAKSMKYSKNRLTEKGGEGVGPSKHTGGSITHEEHARRIQNANTDKVPPTAAEFFLHTHTKKSDRNKFVDKRAEIVYENYLKLKEQYSSQYVGSDHVEGDRGTINENHLFISAAGGWQGSRVYGLGSAASSAFSQIGTGGTSTNVPSSQSPEWKKEIEAKFEEKYSSLQKLVEEQNQMMAQMRDELRAAKMGQQSSSFMPSSSDIHPAHRSLGDSHMD